MAVYSHSKLSTFEQCPLKFKFRYIDKIEPEIKHTIETFLGDQVHKTLEHLYKQAGKKKILRLSELLEYYRKSWKKEYTNEVKIVKTGGSPLDYFNKGKKFLEDYYNLHKPFDDKTIATEKKVLADLDGTGKYQVIGFIDRLVFNETHGAYEIHDYKTSSFLKTQEELDGDRQLAIYSIAVRDLYPDAKMIFLKWHFLAHNKEIISFRTEKEIEQLKKDTIDLIETINSTQDFSPSESALCNWCEFKEYCTNHKSSTKSLEKAKQEEKVETYITLKKFHPEKPQGNQSTLHHYFS